MNGVCSGSNAASNASCPFFDSLVSQSITTIRLNAPAVSCDAALQLAINAKLAPTYFCSTELKLSCCNACKSDRICVVLWKKQCSLILTKLGLFWFYDSNCRIQCSSSQRPLLGLSRYIFNFVFKGNSQRTARVCSLSKTLWRSQV